MEQGKTDRNQSSLIQKNKKSPANLFHTLRVSTETGPFSKGPYFFTWVVKDKPEDFLHNFRKLQYRP